MVRYLTFLIRLRRRVGKENKRKDVPFSSPLVKWKDSSRSRCPSPLRVRASGHVPRVRASLVFDVPAERANESSPSMLQHCRIWSSCHQSTHSTDATLVAPDGCSFDIVSHQSATRLRESRRRLPMLAKRFTAAAASSKGLWKNMEGAGLVLMSSVWIYGKRGSVGGRGVGVSTPSPSSMRYWRNGRRSRIW